jgi:hypothetical protein
VDKTNNKPNSPQPSKANNKLERMLLEHRRLALARGPLTERIRVLRELIKLGGANPGWQQDLEQYERARLREIRAAAKDAFDCVNLGTLNRLCLELLEPWVMSAAAAAERRTAEQYRRKLQKVEEDLKLEKAIERIEAELRTLVPALNWAMEENDLDEARSIRQALCKLAEQAKNLMGGDLSALSPESRSLLEAVKP